MGSARNTNRGEYYKDWSWDPLNVTQEEGKLDLSDQQTSFLESQGLTQEEFDSIETQFVDELYGTTEGKTLDENGNDLGLSQAEWQATYFDDASAIASNQDTSVWGLDLRRTMLDEDGGEITSSHPEYYEHLTRGEVDWGSYQNDPKYNEVWGAVGVDKGKLTSDEYTDADKAEWIRKADHELANPYLDDPKNNSLFSKHDNSHEEWEGKHDNEKVFRDKDGGLWMKDESGVAQRQPTLKELYQSPDGRLDVNKPGLHKAILKRRKVGRPEIPGIKWTRTGKGWDKPSLTNPTKVKIPRNVRGLMK